MKTDQELELMCGYLRAETFLFPEGGVHKPAENPAVRRLRQLERDAVLDFIDCLDEHDGYTARALRSIATGQGITRAPSGGCKSGRCGTL